MQDNNANTDSKICSYGISLRFKQVRLQANLTQKRFGLSLGIGPTTVSKIEKSKKTLDCAVLLLLRQNYKTDINWLLTGEKKPSETCGKRNFSFLDDLNKWLEEIVEDDSDRSQWLRLELIDKIPLFGEWLKKRN